jgi:hypothetical protein
VLQIHEPQQRMQHHWLPGLELPRHELPRHGLCEC